MRVIGLGKSLKKIINSESLDNPQRGTIITIILYKCVFNPYKSECFCLNCNGIYISKISQALSTVLFSVHTHS